MIECALPGRSVVASAPALGAGDREFESPRPDRRRYAARFSSLGDFSGTGLAGRIASTRADQQGNVEPDACAAHRRSALRRVQAPRRRRLQAGGAAGAHTGLSAGQGPCPHPRPARRPWAHFEEALHEALPDLYSQAVEQAELLVLSRPEVDITKLEDGDQLVFTAEMDVRPEITVPDYEGMEITVDEATVSDEDLDEQLTGLRDRFAVLVPVERPARTATF